MSLESFIRLYQELLTMIDPDDMLSVEFAKSILHMIFVLARRSGKADSVTLRCMDNGVHSFERIARHRDDFAGKPGDFAGNNAKRQRLTHMLRPGC